MSFVPISTSLPDPVGERGLYGTFDIVCKTITDSAGGPHTIVLHGDSLHPTWFGGPGSTADERQVSLDRHSSGPALPVPRMREGAVVQWVFEIAAALPVLRRGQH